MRLARLDLLRYGHFTDAFIELPRNERDIHIIFGPNEAGKTTSLTAIEDLLFGIPERSPYDFKHSYDAMRLGAVLEQDGGPFEFQRRKSRKEMILDSDGLPLAGDERLLAPFLGGADRAYFDRMFNLSHSRLAEGGKAIIEAKDDVGQMLFSAGTGLADLRERLTKLEQEAEGLWASRKSEKRRYYQAQARLEEAKRRQRDHSLSVGAWRATRGAYTEAEQTYVERRQARESMSAELKKLARIRRIHRSVRAQAELLNDIAALGSVTLLPENAADLLAEAENRDAKVRAQVAVLEPQLVTDRQELDGLSFDEVLVRRADEVAALNEMRIALRGARRDLPKRRDEFRLAVEALARLASEIGWTFGHAEELIDRVPSRTKMNPVRSLLARDGEVTAELRSARRALEEAQAVWQEQTGLLHEMGEASDVSKLAAVLTSVRESVGVMGRMDAFEGRIAEVASEIDRRVRALKPALAEDIDIEAIGVPLRDTVVRHRDEVRELDHRLAENKRKLTDARSVLERDRSEVVRRVRDEGLLTSEILANARTSRDELWSLVRASCIDASDLPKEAALAHADALNDLPGAFIDAVQQADNIADRRFDQAKAAGEFALLARGIAGHEALIDQLGSTIVELDAERVELNEAWGALWTGLPIKLLAPDVMLGWLEAREEIIELIAQRQAAENQLAAARKEKETAIAQVQAALAELGSGADAIKSESLRILIEQAETYRREQEAKAESIVSMRDAVRKAKSETGRRQRELDQAQVALKNWQAEWRDALVVLDLPGESKPDAVDAQIKVIDEMREHTALARDLRDKRISPIERDVSDFEASVDMLVADLAPHLAGTNSEEAALELNVLRESAMNQHQRHAELVQAVSDRQKQIYELETSRRACWTSIEPLYEIAGLTDVDRLRNAIAQSDRARSLHASLEAVTETLTQQGDGLSSDALQDECRDVDIDAIQAREEAAETELSVMTADLESAVEARTQARVAFDAIGGDDAAARAAADCEEARAAMREAAEQYVRVRTSSILLRWAIDRYRKEKQGPLLRRAGELFSILTRGSFERLEVGFDEKDSVRLMGVRRTGEVVLMPGLSTGTEDQLFLALRIAAIEDYLARAAALPFVADDLFINFDKARATAGFEVLEQLSERTQVLFYTHDEHLVDVARSTLGSDVHIVQLADMV